MHLTPDAASPLGDRITVTLHALVERIDAFADHMLRAQFRITYSQFFFLAVLSSIERPGHPDVTEMAECLGVSKAAVSKRLTSFVDAGWITLPGDPANARRVVLALTPAARELVANAAAALDASFTEHFSRITSVDLVALHDDLKTVIRVLDEQSLDTQSLDTQILDAPLPTERPES